MPYYKRKREEIVAESYDGTELSIQALNTVLSNIGATAVTVEGSDSALISGSFGKFMLLKDEVLIIDESRGARKISSEELNKNWEQ